LYEGNGSTQYISNVGFDLDVDNGGDGGLVWIKVRSASGYYHNLFDTIRGATYRLMSNLTSQQDANGQLTSFDANGFSLGAGGDVNPSQSMVAWVWKGGGDDVLNEEGTIDSQVSANTEAGFSIVKYTGTSTSGATIGHGLDNPPEMVILKNLDSSANWYIYHKDTGTTSGYINYLKFDSTTGSYSDKIFYPVNFNSSTLTPGYDSVLQGNMIAYCFHSVAGYSKIGSYTGGGTTKRIYVDSNDDGTGTGGFKPSFVMIKASSSLGGNQAYGSWVIHDDKRAIESTDNVTNPLYANKSYQEGLRGNGSSGSGVLDLAFNDDGFTINHNGYEANGSGIAYIYMAFK
jgi:hypothetical protein